VSARPQPQIVFAHGAGAPSSHPWMQGWRDRLTALGSVHTFDYPYMLAGRKAPDRPPALLHAHREAIAAAHTATQGDRPLILAGKSMGARISCIVAGIGAEPEDPPVSAIVCFGFPLGRGDKVKARASVLHGLTTPVLFVQGTRDPLCALADLEAVRADMPGPSAVHVVQGGDHSLKVSKRVLKETGHTQEDSDNAAQEAVATFLAQHVP